ncbi:MAG: hypothetical protein U9R51_05255, partial [Actinomycetota bacterium]|nr:hypothetical protein [Actinomycetota bacterium]
MRQHLCALSIVVVIIIAGCADTETVEEQSSIPPATTATTIAATTATTTPAVTATTRALIEDGCGEPRATPGEYEGLSVVGDVERPYWVVVPETYADAAPAPLYLHLASGNGDHDGFLAGWRPYLDDLDGVMAIVNTQQRATTVELVALIDELSSNYCIDPHRVHVMGTSWSEDMAVRLACEAPDRIASFVGALGSYVPLNACQPDRAVPLLTFTGNPDRLYVTRLVERWAELNVCDPEPLVEDLGSGVRRLTYQDCEADVVFYDIEGMGHAWPVHESKGPGAGYTAEYEEVDYLEEAL